MGEWEGRRGGRWVKGKVERREVGEREGGEEGGG